MLILDASIELPPEMKKIADDRRHDDAIESLAAEFEQMRLYDFWCQTAIAILLWSLQDHGCAFQRECGWPGECGWPEEE